MTELPTPPRPDRTSAYVLDDVTSADDRVRVLEGLLSRAEDRAAWIQDICAALGSYQRQDELLAFIMGRIALIMNAERAILYMCDAETGSFFGRTVGREGIIELRVTPGVGLVGWVARTGTSLNLRDASLDPRFDSARDERLGTRTTSILCQPMRDTDAGIIGVVEVANKRSEYFTVEDASLLSAITNTASIVIQNHQLYLESRDQNMRLQGTQRQLELQLRRLDTLHELHRRIAEAEDVDETVAVVARALADTVASYGCAITIVDGAQVTEHAWTRDSRAEAFRPSRRTWDPSIRALVIETGTSTRRSISPYRADAAAVTGRVPALTAKPVTSVAAVPLRAEGETFGCVELVNRARESDDERLVPEYDDDDLKLMDLVAGEISRAVARSIERRRREMQGRLSAIGQMLSGIIHDSRTPLSIASGYVQLMARTDDPERRQALADKVAKQIAVMNEMNNEVLAYARGETTLYLRTVHMSVLADEVRELIESDCTRCAIEVDVRAGTRDDVRIDEGKLKRIVLNLARNARDAMAAGGRLSVSFDRDGDWLVLRVADTGPGIPREIQSRVYDAFVTAGKQGGTGLGLAIVRKLVEEHGGTIDFSSTSRGTTFTVRVPAGMVVEPPAIASRGL